jgi:hypothetical protein
VIGVVFLADEGGGAVRLDRIPSWSRVEAFDADADIGLLQATLDDLVESVKKDPRYIEIAEGWDTSVRLDPPVKLPTLDPDKDLDRFSSEAFAC